MFRPYLEVAQRAACFGETDENELQALLGDVVTGDDPHEMYEVDSEELGEGVSSTVFKATKIANDKVEVAIKVIKLLNQYHTARHIKEILVMKQMHHPNIVNYMDSYCEDRKKNLWIVMEYMAGGTLKGIINKQGTDDEEPIATVCREVLTGLEYMHRNNWVHRDIKSDNILLGLDGRVILADFGFAVRLTEQEEWSKEWVGSINYLAPEMFAGKGYGKEIDVWALGILAFEMREGSVPYLGKQTHESLRLIKKNGKPNLDNLSISEKFRSFLNACLEKDVSKRASAAVLLNHEFLEMAKPISILIPLIEGAKTKEIVIH